MNKLKEFIWVFFAALACYTAFLALVFPTGLANLNSTFFSSVNDGIKNYFTFLHYLKFESGFVFKGMAYPYQDLITFTDNQPLLVLLLKLFGAPETISLTAALAIFNVLMLLALPLSVYFLYKIFQHYEVKPFPAFLFAFAIAMLAPQNERMFGHYGLAYGFFIPALWYLNLKFLQSFSRTYLYLSLAFVTFMSFLHMYYLAISLVFFGFTALGYFLMHLKQFKHTWKNTLQIVLMGVLPILLVKIFMWVMDTKTDRVEIPWGFLNYRATFRSIFFAAESPFDKLIPEAIKVGKYEWEGDAYLSFLGLFFAAFVVFVTVKNWVRTKTFTLNLIELPSFTLYIYTGVFALIFAAVFPFYMPPLDYFIQFLKPILQFRSPGRFAWIFYYVFTVFMLLYFYRKTIFSVKPLVKYLYVLPATLLMIEGFSLQASMFAAVNQHNEGKTFLNADWQKVMVEHKLDTSQYRALIALPFFTIGNEKAGFSGSENSVFSALSFTYNTGLPMVNYIMSRASVSEGLKITAIMSHPILPNYYFYQFEDEKPFLIMVTPNGLAPFEESFLAKANYLFTHNDIRFYSLNPAVFPSSFRYFNDSITKVPVYESHLKDVFATTPKLGFFKYEKYEGINMLFGEAVKENTLSGKQTLFEGKINSSDSIEISFWTRSQTAINRFANLLVTEKDPNGNTVYHCNSHLEPYPQIHSECRRVALTYKPKSSENSVLIEADGSAYKLASFLMFERPNHVYFPTTDEMIIWDNYPLEVDTMFTVIKP